MKKSTGFHDLIQKHRKKKLSAKERLTIFRQVMPMQPLAQAKTDMAELELGYTEQQARLEAVRCLQCPTAPCRQGCPVGVNVPAFIAQIADGYFNDAYDIITEANLLPAICGRVCPQEKQCMANCLVGKAHGSVGQAVSIGALERFAADYKRTHSSLVPHKSLTETAKKVAIIGSGPSGLAAAGVLRQQGHHVEIFEALHKGGGVLAYGIPEFRLPKAIVNHEIKSLERQGVVFRYNTLIGQTITIKNLFEKEGFLAVYIAGGAGLPLFLNIPGENALGVVSANEYLTRVNLMHAYQLHAATPIKKPARVAVLGGGNVAMDAARTAVRLGADRVHLIYRRTEEEIPARADELHHAQEEGVIFHYLSQPKAILSDDDQKVTAVECRRCRLGDVDASGRRASIEIEGDTFSLDVDLVIVAIGNKSNTLLSMYTDGLATDKKGRIVVDNNGMTSLSHVYAGGDIVSGAATVILAMAAGKQAASMINQELAE